MNTSVLTEQVTLELPAIAMSHEERTFVLGACAEHDISLTEFARAALLEAAHR